MALFKKILIPYNIYKFDKDNYLILKCSSQNMVKAPFDGDFTVTGVSTCTLEYNGFKLLFSNVSPMAESKKVEAGEYICKPMTKGGITYIAVKLLKNNLEQDIIKYLRFKDKTLVLKNVELNDVIENKKASSEENKLKTTKSKKKNTKKK